LVVVVLALWTW
jgi:hypothetical protein